MLSRIFPVLEEIRDLFRLEKKVNTVAEITEVYSGQIENIINKNFNFPLQRFEQLNMLNNTLANTRLSAALVSFISYIINKL